MLTAIALTIFMVEAQIPAPVPVPGVKLGLANIVTVYAMFLLGPADTFCILLCRIFLGSLFSLRYRNNDLKTAFIISFLCCLFCFFFDHRPGHRINGGFSYLLG